MKRAWLALAAIVAVLFGAAAISRLRRDRLGSEAASSGNAARIREFWSAYQQASEARTRGDYERASVLFREALSIDASHEDSRFYLAICLEETGRYLEAAEALRELTERNPRSGRGFSHLGSILAKRAPGNRPDPEAAARAFVRAEEINREHSGPFLSRGNLALDLGDLAEASRLFRIASDMSSPEGSFLAGLTSYLKGNEGDAVRYFTRVLETSAREDAINGRGVSSEGDVELSEKLTPLESARIRALVFLYWTARRAGGYAEGVPEWARIELPERIAMGRAVDKPSASRSPCVDPGALAFEGTLVDVTCADYDADGDTDVFLLFWKKPGRLFRSEPTGFSEVTGEAGLAGVGGEGLSTLFFDYDRDGDPDLLVTAHAPLALSLRRLLSPEGRAKSLTPRLFENEAGRFVEVTSKVGLDRPHGVVEAEAFDVDSDGWLDLVFAMGGFEASHLEPSVVLRNRGSEEFVEWAHVPSSDEPHNASGVEVSSRGGEVEILLETWSRR